MTAMTCGVILYGPPAAGKDTVTRELHTLDVRYELFPRLKVGGGRTVGYRMATEALLDSLRARREIVWENYRYDAVYLVDRPELVRRLNGEIPVLHLGQLEAIDAVVRATPDARWLIVYLWCSRDVAAHRIVARGTGDVDARLRAWDETKPVSSAHLTVNTGATSAQAAALEIHRRLDHLATGRPPLRASSRTLQ
jgi:guanylate kinase